MNIKKILIICWTAFILLYLVMPRIDRLNNWSPIIEPAKASNKYISIEETKAFAHTKVTLKGIVNNKEALYAFFTVMDAKGDGRLEFILEDNNKIQYKLQDMTLTGNTFSKDLMMIYPPLLKEVKEVTFTYERFGNIVTFTVPLTQKDGSEI